MSTLKLLIKEYIHFHTISNEIRRYDTLTSDGVIVRSVFEKGLGAGGGEKGRRGSVRRENEDLLSPESSTSTSLQHIPFQPGSTEERRCAGLLYTSQSLPNLASNIVPFSGGTIIPREPTT